MPFPLPLNESERLKALASLQILDTAAEQEFDDLTRIAALICGVPISLVSLIDADRQWFKSKIGVTVSETPRETAFCAHAILQEEVFVVEDALQDARFADNPLVTGNPNIRFYAGAPIIAGEGHAVGTICVIDSVPHQLSRAQTEALQSLARQATALLKVRLQASELENANLLLRTSEESYRVVTESASDAIITIDEDSRILFANSAVQEIFGFAPGELVGQDLSVIAPERYRAQHRAGLQRYLQTSRRGIPWSGVVLPGLHRSGREIQLELSFGEHTLNGRRCFTSVIRDITEREEIEAKLQRSEERYRFLTESIPQQIWAARPDGFINYGNQRAVEYFGQETKDGLAGIEWHGVIHPEDIAYTIEHWSRAVQYGEHYEHEHRLRRHDGEYRWHLAQAVPLRDKDGKIIKWYGTNTDIHERKEAEAAFRQAEGYRNLFQNANDAILILDLETETVLDANEKACEMYGLLRQEFLGRSMKDLSQDTSHGDKYLRELQTSGSYQTFETVQFRADGTALELLINSSVIDYNGQKVVLSINRDVTQRNRTDRLLIHNALHDALTRLPNRALFTEHLKNSIERHARHPVPSFAVLFLDFDRFKIINDSLGHLEGDNLLIMFAARLNALIRPGDVVARLGGDEFTVLLDGIKTADEAQNIARRIHESLKHPFMLGGHEIFINVSIGIALADAVYTNSDEVLRDADIAMYRAKAGGRGRTEVFDSSMHEQASSRLRLENELRQAIEREEFCVYYQPIIDLRTDRLTGFEALVRWRHPVRGIVSPLDFIPLAEETGLIIPLGEWVLRESCRQLNFWQKQHPAYAELTISVNLSCRQFIQPNLVERVAAILQEFQIKPRSLRLEVTESHLMDDSEAAIEIMNRLRSLGVKLSIDDFGTGYSSLSYLHRLPVDYLKIDRSFVSRMQTDSEDSEIVHTIITLAKNLGLETIAEGIETAQQAKQLGLLKCTYGQGYLYSKPVAAGQAGELLIKHFSNDIVEN